MDAFLALKSIHSYPSFHEFFNALYHEQRVMNDETCLCDARRQHKTLLKKINEHRFNKMTEAERQLISTETMLEKIQTDPFLRSFFRKDPSRQSIHEKAQIAWIKTHRYSDFKKLPADQGGLCFSKYRMHRISKENPRPSSGATKTLDAVSKTHNVYCCLKYTNESGGAQDNQFHDVKDTLRQVVGYLQENPEATETFEFYTDGAYYTSAKLKCLRDLVPEDMASRVVLTSCASIVPVLENV
jgi:hypothetical protein